MKENMRHHAKPDKLIIYNYSKDSTSPPPEMPFKEEYHRIPNNEYYVTPNIHQTSFWKYPKNDGSEPSKA